MSGSGARPRGSRSASPATTALTSTPRPFAVPSAIPPPRGATRWRPAASSSSASPSSSADRWLALTRPRSSRWLARRFREHGPGSARGAHPRRGERRARLHGPPARPGARAQQARLRPVRPRRRSRPASGRRSRARPRRGVRSPLDVPFARTRVAVARGGNLQARARAARWDALRVAASRSGADRIATGHHADDRAETLIMRLLRGTTARGLAVLPPVDRRDGVRVRPLYRARRLDVEAHVARHRLPCARDPSNEDPRFLRTRVRRRGPAGARTPEPAHRRAPLPTRRRGRERDPVAGLPGGMRATDTRTAILPAGSDPTSMLRIGGSRF